VKHASGHEPRCGGDFKDELPNVPYTFSVMRTLTRITTNPLRMGGRPCIRDLRVTVGTLVGLVAAGHHRDEILRLYPYLEDEDITEALAYAAWRADEFEVPRSSR
jgi:uncharacterized protein (DUF433 family)